MVHCTAFYNGEFMINYLSRNFNSYNYINLMKESVTPCVEKHHKKYFIWQHDGASVHRLKITTEHCFSNDIKVLPLAAKSPDLTLVKNMSWLV